MQALGARKWHSGLNGDNVGEPDGVKEEGILTRRGPSR